MTYWPIKKKTIHVHKLTQIFILMYKLKIVKKYIKYKIDGDESNFRPSTVVTKIKKNTQNLISNLLKKSIGLQRTTIHKLLSKHSKSLQTQTSSYNNNRA